MSLTLCNQLVPYLFFLSLDFIADGLEIEHFSLNICNFDFGPSQDSANVEPGALGSTLLYYVLHLTV